MLINCPECGKQVSDKAKACPQCGFSLNDNIICEECGTRNKKDAKECSNCGYPFEKENDKCVFCGGILDDEGYCDSCGMDNKDISIEESEKEEKTFLEKTASGLKTQNDIYYARPKNSSINNLQQKQYGCFTVLIKGIGIFIAIFIGILVLASLAESCSSDEPEELTAEDFDTYDEYVESKKIVSDEPITENENIVEPIVTAQAVVKNVNSFESELQEYDNGEYKYITNSDLSKYHTNLEGQKFYIVAEVNEYEESVIRITLDDGYMMSTFNCKNDYSDKIQEEQNVAIMGVVGGYNDYGVMGKSIELNDCMIFAVGEDTEQYDLGVSDESFSEFFVVTDKVADTNNDITEEEYKSICQKLDYEDILRNPDTYDDTYCIIEGTASQIIEGWLGSYTIYVDDYNGNTWGCVYYYEDGESHLLEGDSVAIYGECNGTSTTETVLGKQVILPYIEVKYID